MTNEDVVNYRIATSKHDLEQAEQLFKEYAASLSIDLSFQNFEEEINSISKQYGPPEGALLIACTDREAIGCTGIRKLNGDIAELKRMYVKETYRGHKIGAELLRLSLIKAGELGYKFIRLDTLAHMSKAQQLYRSYGFYEIAAYRFNPHTGTVYMELQL